jgi:hypothetical protein
VKLTEEGANAEAPTITEARTASFILTVDIRKEEKCRESG